MKNKIMQVKGRHKKRKVINSEFHQKSDNVKYKWNGIKKKDEWKEKNSLFQRGKEKLSVKNHKSRKIKFFSALF